MICNTSLKCINPHVGQDQFINILESSLITYYAWSFLQIGGWTEIGIDTSGAYGGNFSRLRPVQSPNFDEGRVWESARKDWVWESGVNYIDTNGVTRNPMRPTGVLVNNVLTTGYNIDYPNGRIIFNDAIDLGATVRANHSFRYVNVMSANSPVWQQIQQDSYRVDNTQFLQSGSGSWSIFSNNRVQLPAIVVEGIPRGVSSPYELGSSKLEVSRDVMFTVVAESRGQRNNLVDILSNQSDVSIWLYNTNAVATANAFPLSPSGTLVRNNTYPVLTSETGYRWKQVRMEQAAITEIEDPQRQVYLGVVRTTFTSVL